MFHYALGSKFNTFEYMGATIIYFLKILLKLNFQIYIKLFRHMKKKKTRKGDDFYNLY